MELTERQKVILQSMIDIRIRKGVAPTIREIMDANNIRSPNGVRAHLDALIRKGYITKSRNSARSILIKRLPSGLPFIEHGELLDEVYRYLIQQAATDTWADELRTKIERIHSHAVSDHATQPSVVHDSSE